MARKFRLSSQHIDDVVEADYFETRGDFVDFLKDEGDPIMLTVLRVRAGQVYFIRAEAKDN